MREIVFDTETTGLSPQEGHRLVEIGCIELVNRVETGAHFHCYINPERSMPAEAQAVHGLGDAFLADKPVFADVVGEFLAFVGDSKMVAHNARFDFGFLNAELRLAGLSPFDLSERMIDTLELARARHPGAKHSLDALCTRYGIDRSHRTLHGALVDAQLLAQLYVELTGGRQIGLGLAGETPVVPDTPGPGPEHVARSPAPQRTFRPARSFAVPDEEAARHRQFIDQLADPIWQYLRRDAVQKAG